jgi:hypothetical protein
VSCLQTLGKQTLGKQEWSAVQWLHGVLGGIGSKCSWIVPHQLVCACGAVLLANKHNPAGTSTLLLGSHHCRKRVSGYMYQSTSSGVAAWLCQACAHSALNLFVVFT